jgi:hypothetical protein
MPVMPGLAGRLGRSARPAGGIVVGVGRARHAETGELARAFRRPVRRAMA